MAEERFKIGDFLRESDPAKNINKYKQVAEKYDQVVAKGGYNTPAAAVKEFSQLGVAKDGKILDVCTGTGLFGEALSKEGYTNIDGLDMCEDLLKVANGKGVYKKLINALLKSDSCLPITDGSYDAAVMVGAFCPGHVYIDSFTELIRIVKKGGFVCWTHWDLNKLVPISDKYKPETVEAHIENFVKEGKWRRHKPSISLGNCGGTKIGEEWLEVFEVL